MPYAWLQQVGSENAYWPLNKSPFTVGRNEPSDLVIASPRISRQQAHIEYQANGTYALVDSGSQNGTFVNGRQLDETPCQLKDGDEIVFGGIASFRFYDPEETRKGPRIGRLKGIWIEEAVRTVWIDARLVDPPLSPAQYTLLLYLYHRAGQPIAREEIVTAVWSDADPRGISDEAINGLIKRLRQRLRRAQPQEEYLESVRGHGLRLVHPP